jgi:hypothetical protein
MHLLDDNKENIQENIYLQGCNILKELYNIKREKQESTLYVKIEYVESIKNIILHENSYLPFNNFIIKYKQSDEYKIDVIDSIIYDLIFSKLKYNTYTDIINNNGGKELALQKMKENISDYEHFMMNSFNCSTSIIQEQYLAYHILDTIIVEYDHITDNIPQDAINIDDFIKICYELY